MPAIAGRQLTAPGQVVSDGTAFLEFSPNRQNDTVWVRRVPLDGRAAGPAVPVPIADWIGIFSDGSFEFSERDSTGGLGLYRIPPGNTRSVWVGDAPIQSAGATWTSSDDGCRFIVVVPIDRPDIFVLRNFGELLGQ